MNFRYLSLLLAITLISPFLYPQRKYRDGTGIKFDIQAGVNLQSFYGKDFWGENLENQFQPGFHAGPEIIIPIVPDLYLQSGIHIHNKGAIQDTVAGSIKTANIFYAEVPLIVLYRPQLGDGHLLAGFGPYISSGIYGRGPSGRETIPKDSGLNS